MPVLRRLLSNLRPYRGRIVLAVLLSFGAAGLTALSLSSLTPFLDSLFVEGGLESFRGGVDRFVSPVSPGLADILTGSLLTTRFRALASILGAVFLMTVLKGFLRYGNAYIVGMVAVRASRDITNRLFGRLLRQPVLFVEREGVGTVASRFTADADEVVRGLRTLVGTLFREPIQFFFLLVVAVAISPLLTLVSFVIFPVIGLLIRKAGRVAKSNAKRVLTHRSRLLSIVQETFFGIRVVQTFRGEEREHDRFKDENEALLERNRRLVRIEALTSPAMEVLVVLGVGAALLVGGSMAIREELTPGQLVTFYVAVVALYEPIRKLGSAFPRIQAAIAGANRIFAYLDREPEVREAPDAKPLPPFSGSILLDGVSVSYGGTRSALSDLTLEIRAGEEIALVGPSGAGKSTIAGLLPRLFDPDEGAVLVDGRDVRTATLDSVRALVALVPQETILMNDTIRANIAFARPTATDEEVVAAAKAARVDEFADGLPERFDTIVGERGSALSGGQRQRIAIARALLLSPRILVLDEATSNVDEKSARLIREALDETSEGRTTVVITHRLDSLAKADRIALLSEGRLTAVGTHTELLENCAEYRDLHAPAVEPG